MPFETDGAFCSLLLDQSTWQSTRQAANSTVGELLRLRFVQTWNMRDSRQCRSVEGRRRRRHVFLCMVHGLSKCRGQKIDAGTVIFVARMLMAADAAHTQDYSINLIGIQHHRLNGPDRHPRKPRPNGGQAQTMLRLSTTARTMR